MGGGSYPERVMRMILDAGAPTRGNGNNNISAANGENVITNSGSGNNNISASGTDDFMEVLGNGNNHIKDTGSNDFIVFDGDGNNNIDNDGAASFTEILSGSGHNHIRGNSGTGGSGGGAS